MKRALYILVLALLAGCASHTSYYYPVQVPGEGVYLADRPVYGAQPVYGSGASYRLSTMYYSDAVHYPWWSMDYFYFGLLWSHREKLSEGLMSRPALKAVGE